MVVTDLATYEEKMKEFLFSNVESQVYYRFGDLSLEYVKFVCESKYDRIRNVVNSFLDKDYVFSLMKAPLQLPFESFVIPRIYGLFKVHKDGCPVRPIVSATDCLGSRLAEWVLSKLTVIAKHLGKHQVRSAHECFKLLDGRKLNDLSHRLFTLDFDSMFTKIPLCVTKKIIEKVYSLLKGETVMPVEIFLESLYFVIEECPFFVYGGIIYLQADGLAMGNALSQVL